MALAIVWLLRGFLERRGRRIAEAVIRGELSPEVDTRLRLVRRLLNATIIGLGLAVALSQFDEVKTIGRAQLASGAIAAAIIGFAARQTLANVVAGIMIAVTQPVRVGDWVAFEEDYGQVEDVTLSFTTLRTPAERRIVIPNERIASGVIRNDTLRQPTVGTEVSVWLAPSGDADRALVALAELGDAALAEQLPWGTRLTVAGERVAPPERGARENDLRARCVAKLRAEGLL